MKCDNPKCENVFTGPPKITLAVGDKVHGAYWGNFCSHECVLTEVGGFWMHVVEGGNLASWNALANQPSPPVNQVAGVVESDENGTVQPIDQDVPGEDTPSPATDMDGNAPITNASPLLDAVILPAPEPEPAPAPPDLAPVNAFTDDVLVALNARNPAVYAATTSAYWVIHNGVEIETKAHFYKLIPNKLSMQVYGTPDERVVFRFNNADNWKVEIDMNEDSLTIANIALHLDQHIKAVMNNFTDANAAAVNDAF